MWDLEAGRKTTDFIAHNGDVVSISLAPDGNTYVTGSVDKTCRLWDVRENKPKQTFFGHQSDVNSVCVCNYYYYTQCVRLPKSISFTRCICYVFNSKKS